MSFEEIYNYVNIGETSNLYFEINVSTIVGLENYDFYLPVTGSCTETMAKFFEIIEKNNTWNAKLALELADEHLSEVNDKEIYTETEVWTDTAKVHIEMNPERLAILKESQTEGFKAGDSIAKFHISYYDVNTNKNYSYTVYFKLSSKNADTLLENYQ